MRALIFSCIIPGACYPKSSCFADDFRRQDIGGVMTFHPIEQFSMDKEYICLGLGSQPYSAVWREDALPTSCLSLLPNAMSNTLPKNDLILVFAFREKN